MDYIHTSGFRNLASQKVGFVPGWNLVTGDNAQGKTNLVEAIDMFRFGFSFRTRQNTCLVNHDSGAACLDIGFRRGNLETTERIKLGRGIPVSFERDGKTVNRGGILGRFLSVMFSPDDLFISKGDPALRRKYIDMLISQVDRGYYRALLDYRKALLQRNRLLRSMRKDPSAPFSDTASAWESSLQTPAIRIVRTRQSILQWLDARLGQYFSRIYPEGRASLSYTPSWDPAVDGDLAGCLAKSRREDIVSGHTSAGPHRDDISIGIDGRSSRRFGSQGQHRMLAVALKLSEIALVESMTGTAPVLILDDIFSELDAEKAEALAGMIPPDVQVLATSTGMGLPGFVQREARRLVMVKGTVS